VGVVIHFGPHINKKNRKKRKRENAKKIKEVLEENKKYIY
jgi:hypothetical protein